MAKINKCVKARMVLSWMDSMDEQGEFTKTWEQVVAEAKAAPKKKK